MAVRVITKRERQYQNSQETARGAGILLHITSLPSNFGIGDLGPEAKTFVDFLSRCGQRYWQLLPLNPVGAGQNYSPYSSVSSMAGNPLLISPELLRSDGLLLDSELRSHFVASKHIVDFQQAQDIRRKLLPKAESRFFKKKKSVHAFRRFCQREAYWLDDFAMYQALKHHHENKPWFAWSKDLIERSKDTKSKFYRDSRGIIRYTKWEQFVFFKQWSELKTYANSSGVQLFGDLPFYVSLDSSDVWANRNIFNIDKDGVMIGVAGVPPDYFNSNGQLWGMPTFKWDVLKSTGYQWWFDRLRKNMEMFDLLRLDHFRAFASYWEVSGGETTAIRGTWKQGPGRVFFNKVNAALGDLRFVAEDLGDIDEAVFRLRDEFNFPGMKILQFAFGETMPVSGYIPHNYTSKFIAYTGTHDNNTTVGWFLNDLTSKVRRQITSYIGHPINERNIHIELSRLAYASVAQAAILPLQDVLGLDKNARMNTPASVSGNWQWRFKQGALKKSVERRLQQWVKLYNR